MSSHDVHDQTQTGFARDFFCEHTAAKSRVLALVATDNHESLRAVLTCTDRLLAQRAAALLAQAVNGNTGPHMHTETERVAVALPDAPAASFRQALQHVQDRTWPLTDAESLPTYDQIHDSYDYALTDDQPVTPGMRDSASRAPSDARLGDLPGPVFRVVTMLELHVHDPRRLITAAQLTGWTPLSDEDDDTDELDDLLDAVMALAGTDTDVPGTDLLAEESTGEQLDADAGDELADWSPEPITVSLGSGWRLNHSDDIAE